MNSDQQPVTLQSLLLVSTDADAITVAAAINLWCATVVIEDVKGSHHPVLIEVRYTLRSPDFSNAVAEEVNTLKKTWFESTGHIGSDTVGYLHRALRHPVDPSAERPDDTVTVTHFAPITPNTKPSELHRVTACPGKILAPPNPLACNLACRMAWLEGFSVVSECTGEQYCEVLTSDYAESRIKYDPIGRPAIIAELIQKYKVDLDWKEEGGCTMDIYEFNGGVAAIRTHESTNDQAAHNE